MKAWLYVSFANLFMALAFCPVIFFLRPVPKYYMSIFVFLVFIPYVLIFNFVGNFALPRLNKVSGSSCVRIHSLIE